MLGHVLKLKNNKVSPRERSTYLLMSSKKLQNSFLPMLLNHTPTQDAKDLKLLPRDISTVQAIDCGTND